MNVRQIKTWYKKWYVTVLWVLILTIAFPPFIVLYLLFRVWWKQEHSGFLFRSLQVIASILLACMGIVIAVILYSDSSTPTNTQQPVVATEGAQSIFASAPAPVVEVEQVKEEPSSAAQELSPEHLFQALVKEKYPAQIHTIEELGMKSEMKYEVVETVFDKPPQKAWVIYHRWNKDAINPQGNWLYYLEDGWEWNGTWEQLKTDFTSYHGSKPSQDIEFKVHLSNSVLYDRYMMAANTPEEIDAVEQRTWNETAKAFDVSADEVIKYFMHVQRWSEGTEEGKQWLDFVENTVRNDARKRSTEVTASNINVRNEYGIVSVIGELKNNSYKTARLIYITVTFYDKSGRIVDTAVDSQANLASGQTKTFDARGVYHSVFASYKVDIDTLF